MRGLTLCLVTAFAASAVAAPLPNSQTASPVESPLERAEPLVAREPLDAALSPILDNLKRSLLERLDPLKRSAVEDAWEAAIEERDTPAMSEDETGLPDFEEEDKEEMLLEKRVESPEQRRRGTRLLESIE